MRKKIFLCIIGILLCSFVFPVHGVLAAKDDEEEVKVEYGAPMEKGYKVTQCPGSMAGTSGCPSNFSHGTNSTSKFFGTAQAWDMDAADNSSVLSVADGEVDAIGNDPGPMGYGNWVRIKHADGTYSFYAHLSAVSVKEGKDIDGGDKVGVMGNSGSPWCTIVGGRCSGACCGCDGGCTHLHFSLFDENGSPMSTDERIDVFDGEGLVSSGMRKVREGVSAIADTFGINIEFQMEGLEFDYEWNEDILRPDVEAYEMQKVDYGPLAGTIADLYAWSLGMGGLIAMMIIIYGGILYIASGGNPSKRQDAKEWILAAIFGLMLLFGAYLLLHTINPCLVGAC